MSALYAAFHQRRKSKSSIVADGGISKSGDIVKALTLSDAVICGSLLAGCKRSSWTNNRDRWEILQAV